MEHATTDGTELAYDTVGTDEPGVCIHGAFIANSFRPLLVEPSLGRIRKPSQNGRSVPLPRFCEIGEWRKRSKPLLFRGSCGCHSHLDRFADTP